jgi:hypothetical protein
VVGEAQAGLVPDLLVPLDAAQERAIHGWLQVFGPPAELLPELEAWEREEGVPLFARHPSDPQLDAALELLRGRRPGPRTGAVALLERPRGANEEESGSR